ncbi:hypothetical protein PI124_g6898 [Phytophthora idaei]|nr:hypothetical protein PI125_g6547 [Phytophthora idaei]KAG3163148.1 hypothetical protein PI126_g5685 [Phytophthora idaei]KAG3248412.1 hypothetical protein PI124_g6898 [Phytophthora idaei]
MELFAGFNAEELAMMHELLRLLLEDDDVLTQQPTPRTSARQDGQALFDGLHVAGGMAVNVMGDFQWEMGVPNGVAWNAPPAMMAPAPQYAVKTARTRTRSNFGSEDEPILKRGRVDVAPTMRTPVNYIPVPEGSRAGYPYY